MDDYIFLILFSSLFSLTSTPPVNLMFLLQRCKIFHHHKLFLSLFAKDLTSRRGRYLTPVKLSEPAGQVASVQQCGHFTLWLTLLAAEMHLHLLFFIGTSKTMRFTCYDTCWSSVRVCYYMFAQHWEDFIPFFLYFSKWNSNMMGTKQPKHKCE